MGQRLHILEMVQKAESAHGPPGLRPMDYCIQEMGCEMKTKVMATKFMLGPNLLSPSAFGHGKQKLIHMGKMSQQV